jgi:hypothetical protein
LSYDFLEDAADELSKCGFPYAMVMINGEGYLQLCELANTTREKKALIMALRKMALDLEGEIFR